MNKSQIDTLLDKLASGSYTVTEEQQVRNFIHRYNTEGSSGLSDNDFLEAENEMWEVIERASHLKVKSIPMWKPAIAAAAVAVIAFGVWFYTTSHPEGSEAMRDLVINDVAPGKQGATLTLANGKKITLTDAANGEIAKEAGISVTKTVDGQVEYEGSPQGGERAAMNTLSTAKGETYRLRLPDGSLVYLNAASSLTYPASLMENGKRVVKLQGEAYFEIAKLTRSTLPSGSARRGRERVPFIVKTDRQEVEVLGTHFNVNAYKDESTTKTTLLEGSVKVTIRSGRSPFLPEGTHRVVLKPKQQATLADNNKIEVQDVDTESAVSWKNGYFKFNESLESIMNKISRWYNIEVVYEVNPDASLAFGGKISRDKTLSALLKSIESAGGIHFKIEGRRVTVIK